MYDENIIIYRLYLLLLENIAKYFVRLLDVMMQKTIEGHLSHDVKTT